jgi:hypothetical protein
LPQWQVEVQDPLASVPKAELIETLQLVDAVLAQNIFLDKLLLYRNVKPLEVRARLACSMSLNNHALQPAQCHQDAHPLRPLRGSQVQESAMIRKAEQQAAAVAADAARKEAQAKEAAAKAAAAAAIGDGEPPACVPKCLDGT